MALVRALAKFWASVPTAFPTDHSRSGYALVPDLRSGIVVWPDNGTGLPANDDDVIIFLLPAEADVTWKLVRQTVRTELRRRLDKSATLWPPPPAGQVPLLEDYPFAFTLVCDCRPMEGFVMHKQMPRRLYLWSVST